MQKNVASFNIGRLLEDAMGLVQLLKGETKSHTSAGLEQALKKLNLVTRAEFEAVKAIAVAARTQAEDVAERVGLKKKAAVKPKKAATKKTTVKAAARKKTAKKK